MGYNTDFDGRIEIVPPLNQAEIDYLTAFSCTRRMHREQGPFYVDFSTLQDHEGIFCSENEEGVINFNTPPPGQPSLWLNFEPTEDGTAIVWNQSEKTYDAKAWIEYIITRFLSPEASTKGQNIEYIKDFQYNHICNGEFLAQGEDIRDRWLLIVKNNKVSTKRLK